MSIQHATPRTDLDHNDLAEKVAQTLAAAVKRVDTYLAHRRAMRELYQMDDRMLRDIGLSRSRIKDAVNGQGDVRGEREPERKGPPADILLLPESRRNPFIQRLS